MSTGTSSGLLNAPTDPADPAGAGTSGGDASGSLPVSGKVPTKFSPKKRRKMEALPLTLPLQPDQNGSINGVASGTFGSPVSVDPASDDVAVADLGASGHGSPAADAAPEAEQRHRRRFFFFKRRVNA